MDGLLRKLYKTQENVPQEVVQFLKELQSAYPTRCICITETLEQANRYAGLAQPVADANAWLNRK